MKTRITSLLLVFFLAIMSWQAEAQFTESFDTEIPSDWTVINNDGQDETWQFSGVNPFQGAGSANLDYEANAHDDYLITPQFTVTSGVSDRVSFYATANSTFFVETFDVKLSTTGTEPSDFTEVLGSGTTSTVDYAQFVYSLAAYAGQDVYVAVIGTSTNEFHFYLDEFEVGVAPTCPAPSDLAVENTSAESTDVNWTENGTATEWEVVYGTVGFDPETEGMSMIDDDGTLGETITDLDPNTEYDVYVRALWGEGDESEFSDSEDFITECLVISPDYSEGFSEFVPDCWKEAGSGLPSEGPSEFGGSNWIEDDFLNTGSNNSAQINIYFDNRQEWLISPLIDLSGGDYELNYIAAITDYNNSDIPEGNGMGSDDEVQVLITSDNGMTWENLKTYNQADYPSETGDNEVIDLSAYSGTVQIAFWATDGSVNDDEDYDFFIDDFEVTTALSITSNEFNSFAFYPNPAQNVLNLDAQAQIDRVVIHNMLGQKVMERTSNQTQLKLNVADFASGVYFMNVTIDGTQKSFKIIKE